MDTLPEPERILKSEGYKLRRNIGEGGYGRVWMADVPGGDTKALKIVECRDGDRMAYLREREAVERVRGLSLTCECLAPIEDVEDHGDQGFISYTMPLADDITGHPVADRPRYTPRTLAQEIRKRGRLPVQECTAITKRVLEAVKALHEKGLIHRDIKPSNVIYLQGQPVLADFGLVTHEGADVSQVCSPSNIPPEGLGAAQGDLYAVAVLLYRLATGNQAERFPSSTVSNPAEEFQRLVHVFTMAGEKAPFRRYVNARAMDMALDWVLKKEERPRRRNRAALPAVFEQLKRAKKPDAPAMQRFKKRISNIIEVDRMEAASRQDQGQAHMTREAFAETADKVCMAFETRIGHEPPLVRSACLLAQAVMEPSKRERKRLVKQAAAIGGGASGMGMVVGGIGMTLGWGQGFIQGVIVFFMGSPVLWPIALVVGGVTLGAIAAHMYFSKENPAETAERAAKALREGVNAATDELWGEYGDQLSA